MSIQLYQGSPFLGVGAFQGEISGSTITGRGLPGSLSGSATLVAGGYAVGATSTEGSAITASVGHFLQCSVAFSSSIDDIGECAVNDWIIYDSANTKWVKLTRQQMIASVVVGYMSQVGNFTGNTQRVKTRMSVPDDYVATLRYCTAIQDALEVIDGGSLEVGDRAIVLIKEWEENCT